jgi:hypothetical protein
MTAPPCHQGPGPWPAVSFKYNLRHSVRSYLQSLPAGDKWVSDGQGPVPTMSAHSAVGSGSKEGDDEPEVTMKDIVRCLAAIEVVARPLQPLRDQVPQLADALTEQGLQQVALQLAITLIENTLHDGGGGGRQFC